MSRWLKLSVGIGLIFAAESIRAQEPTTVSVANLLKYRPVQKDVAYEIPPAADVVQCRSEVEKAGKGSGYAVYGPQGQALRRFVDSDADEIVDQFRYYQNGMEVYRDIDTNADNKVDQSRWLNAGGSRWGLDPNQDGKIDQWRMISAEEALREAIRAIVSRDVAALQAVMLTAEDIGRLKITGSAAEKLTAAARDPAAQLQKSFGGSKLIQAATKWERFDSSMLMPNTVPADAGVSENDLLVYENVMAIVSNGGETGFIQIGEMVRVGDAWKLTRVPMPVEGESIESEGGIIMGASLAGTTSAQIAGGELSPQMRALTEQVQQLDAAKPKDDAPRADLVAYNSRRAQLLGQLAEAAPTDEEKLTWRRQQIDQIAADTQNDAFPNGVEALAAIESDIAKKSPKSPLIPYVMYRRINAHYDTQMRTADAAGQVELHAAWIKTMEQFVADHSDSDDAADAMLDIARAHEYVGRIEDAKTWYGRLAKDHPKAPATAVAAGALRRLNLKGNPVALTGPIMGGNAPFDIASLRGKVVAVIFWATWCQPCTDDLPQIKELYKQYRPVGFEVIGVNLDLAGAPINEYIQQHKLPWPSIREEGGLQSRIAQQYGIISLPTVFLIDKTGATVSSAASVEDLKKFVPDLVK